jgi:CheY-like chemotaxis protein
VKKGCCILVAEDDDNDVAFLQRAFAKAEIDNPLYFVPDGQAAMDYLAGSGTYADRSQYPLPGLLLLDLKMPRKTGMDVLKWLRGQEAFLCLPIIMFSSSTHPAEIENAYRNGVNAFVTKPSGMPERTELARMIKGFWLTFNESAT